MAAFVCEDCHAEGRDGLVKFKQDRFTIEVAAKSVDGKTRAAQVTLRHSFCKRHGIRFIEDIRNGGSVGIQDMLL